MNERLSGKNCPKGFSWKPAAHLVEYFEGAMTHPRPGAPQ